MSDTLPPFLTTDPDVYEHFMRRWSTRLEDPFLDFAGMKPGSTVLDVGCGTGTMTLAGPARIAQRLIALSSERRNEIERHVQAGYLAGLADGPRSFAAIVRAVRGTAP